MSTYTVKSGDRLSEIARQLGVGVSDISGYRSGNPDVIHPGETLSVKKKTTPTYYTDVMGTGLLNNPTPPKQVNAPRTVNAPAPLDSQSEGAIRTGAGGIREMLDPTGNWRPVEQAGGEAFQVSKKAHQLTPPPTPSTTSPYREALGGAQPAPQTLQTAPRTEYGEAPQTNEYQEKMDAVFNELKDLRSKQYKTEYDKSGLEETKKRISMVDDEILKLREARDESVLKTRQNPYLSASALSGDVSKLADKYNSQINNLIQQRNSLAGEYNTGLNEVQTVVENALKDKSMELEYWANLYQGQQESASARQKALIDELRIGTQADQFDRNLAQQLQIAKMRGSGGGGDYAYKYITNPITGAIEQWVDPRTMEVFPADGRASAGMPTADAVLDGLTPEQQTVYRALIQGGLSPADARAQAQQEEKKSFWSFLPWVD